MDDTRTVKRQPFESPFDASGYWLRGNCHLHTTASDGSASALEEARRYAERGYDFLVVTDHDRFADQIPDVDDLVLIPGAEVHPSGDGIGWHIVGLGGSGAPADRTIDVQEGVDGLRSAGALVVVAHPYWSGLTEGSILNLSGILGVEVFNTTCELHIGKGDSRYVWDQLLAGGMPLAGFAVDDTHAKTRDDRFGGWVMVRAGEKSARAILEALAAGRFYATQGPLIADFRFERGEAYVAAPSVREVLLMGNRARGRREPAGQDAVVCEARWTPPEGTTYVRAEAIDERGRRAWTNPIFLHETERGLEPL